MIRFLKWTGLVVAIFGGVASIGGVYSQLNEIVRLRKKEISTRWDAVFVYEAIRSQGKSGATFSQIREGWLAYWTQRKDKFPISDDESADESLRALLLDLSGRQVLLPTLDDKYFIKGKELLSQRPNDPMIFFSTMDAVIDRLVRTHQGTFNIDALATEVAATMKVRFPERDDDIHDQAQIEIKFLLKQGIYQVDDKGMVRANPIPPFMAMPPVPK